MIIVGSMFGINKEAETKGTKLYESDIQAIIAKRYDNGADLWTTPDKRLGKGGPFSTLESALMLSDLGLTDTQIMRDTAELILSVWKEDGRFQITPNAAIYPCHTAGTARVLCSMGYANDKRVQQTFKHLLTIQQDDGGWRCNTYKFGRGPETDCSNPGTTLAALDAFRYTPYLGKNENLDRAVEFLLYHWEIRKPIGPCLFGIGTRFLKIEYPFFRYNLFFYVHVLSFYDRAKKDSRFLNALSILQSKMSEEKIVVENPHLKLADFSFCKKGVPSELATQRYHEILKNII